MTLIWPAQWDTADVCAQLDIHSPIRERKLQLFPTPIIPLFGSIEILKTKKSGPTLRALSWVFGGKPIIGRRRCTGHAAKDPSLSPPCLTGWQDSIPAQGSRPADRTTHHDSYAAVLLLNYTLKLGAEDSNLHRPDPESGVLPLDQ